MKDQTTHRGGSGFTPWWWEPALLFLLGLLVNLPFLSQFTVGLNDEAVVALGADRLLSGEIPYRDWDSRFPPASYLVTAASFLLFGTNLVGLRLVMLLTNSLLGLACFLLAASLLPRKWALLTWLAVMVGVTTQVTIVSYHLIAIVALLFGVLHLSRWVTHGGTASAGWCGASLAACCFSLQTEAAALLATVVVALAVYRHRVRKREAGWLFGIWIGLSLLLWSWVLLLASPAAIWRDNVAAAVGLTRVFNHSPYNLDHLLSRWGPYLDQLGDIPLTAATVTWAVQVAVYLLAWTVEYGLFFPVLLLIGYAVYRYRGEEKPVLVVCLTALLLFTLISRHRLDMLYLKYLTPLWYLLALWALHRLGRAGRLLGGSLLVLYLVFYGFTLKDAAGYRYPVETRRGTLYSSSPEEAALMGATYRLIASVTPPGEETFFFPYAPQYYFWAAVKNAVRPPVLVPLLYSSEQFEEARMDLRRSRPEYIYHVPLGAGVLADYPRLDPAALHAEYQKQMGLLFAGYEPITRGPNLEVFRRRDGSDSTGG